MIGSGRDDDYKADGYLIEKIYKENLDGFVFVEQELCYYNWLKKPLNFTPKVLYIGQEEPELKSFKAADYESDDLRVLHKKSDEDISQVLREFNPDAILTHSETWEDFKKLGSQPLDVRSRWIHVKDLDLVSECMILFLVRPVSDSLLAIPFI